MAKELWKDVEGYNGDYLISNHGRIYSEKSKIYLKTAVSKKGYVHSCLCFNGKQRTFTVHKLVGIHFLYKPDWADQINHLDRNKMNNHYSNLEWTNNKLNIAHAFKTGVPSANRKGERNSMSKLSEDEIREIIILKNNKIKGKFIAEKFGITPGHVYRIANGERWSHIVV